MKILIIGATSAIAQATARLYAKQAAQLHLLARDAAQLDVLAADLRVRGATVTTQTFDASAMDTHEVLLQNTIKALGEMDVVLIAYGTLSDQKACEHDAALVLHEMNTNALSVMGLLTHLANYFEARGHGTIAVISSVAGDRGRASNYVYGAAKGALTLFLEGLRNRLHKRGVQVLTIKPGFVDTPMTRDFKKGPLWASPEKVAADIVRAIERKRDVIYTPWFWWIIMTIIKSIPERIFKGLSL